MECTVFYIVFRAWRDRNYTLFVSSRLSQRAMGSAIEIALPMSLQNRVRFLLSRLRLAFRKFQITISFITNIKK